MIKLAENRYGKSRVRLLKVTRHQQHHDIAEWTVEVLLHGAFETAHTVGDNSSILPTDTMKNTVYFMARKSTADSMEHFAKDLVDFLLSRNPQVDLVEVTVESSLWKRISVDGTPHPTAFIHGSNEVQTAHVTRRQNGEFRIVSGLRDLVILKSAQSAFEDYIVDDLTTLKPTNDRIFATACKAVWVYESAAANSAAVDYNELRKSAREAMLRTFAHHDSKSVQQTLYAMAASALESTPQIEEMTLTMPNKHALLVDLSRFGQDNPNQIFVPTDEPHGTIEARVIR